MIYANHAGTSWPKPAAVHRAILRALEQDPTTTAARFEAVRATVADFIGAGDPDDAERLLFTGGCTQALDVAIADLPWREGDVVITSALEHHALARPVRKLVRERGVVHRIAPYREGEPVDRDFVADTLREGHVRLVAMSHASNVTGEVLPVDDVIRLAHAHDALFLLDAAQTVGVLPVDVKRIGPDLLAFAGHKGPQGPQGIGALWAAPRVEFASPTASCTIGPGPAPGCTTFPGYCDVGSVNMAAAAGLAAGLQSLADRGPDATGGHARRLAQRLREELDTRAHCRRFGSADGESTAAVSLAIDRLPIERAESVFAERGIVIRAGEHCAPMALEAIGAARGTVRISFGPTSEEGDVDAILAAIDSLA